MLFEAFLAQILAQSAASSLPAPASPPAPASFTCPSGMLPVEGVHYENIQRFCTDLRGKNCFSLVPGLVAREL